MYIISTNKLIIILGIISLPYLTKASQASDLSLLLGIRTRERLVKYSSVSIIVADLRATIHTCHFPLLLLPILYPLQLQQITLVV